jgi:hypothetical protein
VTVERWKQRLDSLEEYPVVEPELGVAGRELELAIRRTLCIKVSLRSRSDTSAVRDHSPRAARMEEMSGCAIADGASRCATMADALRGMRGFGH